MSFDWESNTFDIIESFMKQDKGELLITPIPGYSTHGETAWLTPLYNWDSLI